MITKKHKMKTQLIYGVRINNDNNENKEGIDDDQFGYWVFPDCVIYGYCISEDNQQRNEYGFMDANEIKDKLHHYLVAKNIKEIPRLIFNYILN